MLGVLLKAPWYIEGKGLLLEKWHEDFDPRKEDVKLVPVWVQIRDMPLQSWDDDVIRSIANSIGKLVAIDSATSNRTRLIHARFCVLIRTDEPVPTMVELDMGGRIWEQELVYEEVKVRCPKCRGGGHLVQFCKGKPEGTKEASKKEWVPKGKGTENQDVTGEKEEKKEKEGIEEEAKTDLGGAEEEAEEEEETEEEGGRGEEAGRGIEETIKEKAEEEDKRKEAEPKNESDDMGDGFERVQTRRSRRKAEGGKMDVGSEEKKVGRPSEKERREKEAASQIDLGFQKTLDSVKGKAKIRS